MTEGERAHYKRRIREELQLARAVGSTELKELHLSWAQFFNDRLDGKRKTPPPSISRH